MEDCNCQAALYKDWSCRKQGLPLSSGRKVLTDSNVASIKVGVGISTPNINKIVPMEREKKASKGNIVYENLICSFWTHYVYDFWDSNL